MVNVTLKDLIGGLGNQGLEVGSGQFKIVLNKLTKAESGVLGDIEVEGLIDLI